MLHPAPSGVLPKPLLTHVLLRSRFRVYVIPSGSLQPVCVLRARILRVTCFRFQLAWKARRVAASCIADTRYKLPTSTGTVFGATPEVTGVVLQQLPNSPQSCLCVELGKPAVHVLHVCKCQEQFHVNNCMVIYRAVHMRAWQASSTCAASLQTSRAISCQQVYDQHCTHLLCPSLPLVELLVMPCQAEYSKKVLNGLGNCLVTFSCIASR